MSWSKDILTIRGKKIPVKVGMITQDSLRFYPENPRIYSIVRTTGQEPEQDDILTELLKREHVKALVQDIELNGGLLDAVIVRDGSLEVLEGNSRLAAYRALAAKDPIRWGKIKCKLLPKNIDEADIFALLGQYHIKGKKDWAPYEQAGFLYRRYKFQDVPKTELGKELGLGRRRVSQLIETYQFMIDHKDNNVNRWSYYEELIKSNKIRGLRNKFDDFDAAVVKMIKSETFARAADVRDTLPKLSGAPSKIVRKFLAREIDLSEAAERAEQSGSSDAIFQKLNRFRKWLVQSETEEEIFGSKGAARDKIKFEVDKLQTNFRRISKVLSKPT